MIMQKVYSKGIIELDKTCASYVQKEIGFSEYLAALTRFAKKAKVDMTKYKRVAKFIELTGREKKLNFKKAESEREALIKRLSAVLKKEAMAELVTKSINFRLNRLSSEEYHSYLYLLAPQTEFRP